jgi:hypothetical protein
MIPAPRNIILTWTALTGSAKPGQTRIYNARRIMAAHILYREWRSTLFWVIIIML